MENGGRKGMENGVEEVWKMGVEKVRKLGVTEEITRNGMENGGRKSI